MSIGFSQTSSGGGPASLVVNPSPRGRVSYFCSLIFLPSQTIRERKHGIGVHINLYQPTVQSGTFSLNSRYKYKLICRNLVEGD